jgi:hypothetical protein
VGTNDLALLWSRVEGQLQASVPKGLRVWFQVFENVDDAWQQLDDRSRSEYVAELAEKVTALWDADLTDSGPTGGEQDEAWELWSDLRAVVAREGGLVDPFSILSIFEDLPQHAPAHTPSSHVEAEDSWRPVVIRLAFDETAPPLFSERIEISVDSRLSLRKLKDLLDGLWPFLLREEWVRRTRPLTPKAAAVVRFVCIQNPPDTRWRDLFAEWNARYPDRRYGHVRVFSKDFRRAEQQLTGRKSGLSWFYSSRVRKAEATFADVPTEVLYERRSRGERLVDQYLSSFVDPLANYGRMLRFQKKRVRFIQLRRAIQDGVVTEGDFRNKDLYQALLMYQAPLRPKALEEKIGEVPLRPARPDVQMENHLDTIRELEEILAAEKPRGGRFQ